MCLLSMAAAAFFARKLVAVFKKAFGDGFGWSWYRCTGEDLSYRRHCFSTDNVFWIYVFSFFSLSCNGNWGTGLAKALFKLSNFSTSFIKCYYLSKTCKLCIASLSRFIRSWSFSNLITFSLLYSSFNCMTIYYIFWFSELMANSSCKIY